MPDIPTCYLISQTTLDNIAQELGELRDRLDELQSDLFDVRKGNA